MKCVVQRVSRAGVSFTNKYFSIGRGLVVLLGIGREDREEDSKFLAEKIVNLRIFPDEHDKFNFSCLDIKGEILVVSQFTLQGDCRKGRRPDFTAAASPEIAENFYNIFIEKIRKTGLKVVSGQFRSSMQVDIHNDGPVTLIVES